MVWPRPRGTPVILRSAKRSFQELAPRTVTKECRRGALYGRSSAQAVVNGAQPPVYRFRQLSPSSRPNLNRAGRVYRGLSDGICTTLRSTRQSGEQEFFALSVASIYTNLDRAEEANPYRHYFVGGLTVQPKRHSPIRRNGWMEDRSSGGDAGLGGRDGLCHSTSRIPQRRMKPPRRPVISWKSLRPRPVSVTWATPMAHIRSRVSKEWEVGGHRR